MTKNKKKFDYYDFNEKSNKNENSNANHDEKDFSSQFSSQDNPFIELMKFSLFIINYQCKKCRFNFSFNNKLYKHVRSFCFKKKFI